MTFLFPLGDKLTIQRPKCLKVARELLSAGKSVAVGTFFLCHNPNPPIQTNKSNNQTTQTPTPIHDPTGSLSPKTYPSLSVAFSSCLHRNYVDITTPFAPRIKNWYLSLPLLPVIVANRAVIIYCQTRELTVRLRTPNLARLYPESHLGILVDGSVSLL